MESERLEYFRKLLQERLEEILGEADKTRNDMTGVTAPFPDPTDRATLETDRNFTLRIRDRERKLISKIREALERIDAGTYGYCELCAGSQLPCQFPYQLSILSFNFRLSLDHHTS
ncbi:MAG: RNA polymerase-binding protein DksA [Deltaproteobacteria bacterium]